MEFVVKMNPLTTPHPPSGSTFVSWTLQDAMHGGGLDKACYTKYKEANKKYPVHLAEDSYKGERGGIGFVAGPRESRQPHF